MVRARVINNYKNYKNRKLENYKIDSLDAAEVDTMDIMDTDAMLVMLPGKIWQLVKEAAFKEEMRPSELIIKAILEYLD
jgi:hypothetical protein